MYELTMSRPAVAATPRVHPAGPRHRAAGGRTLLSARERQIAELVAAGLTNREIAADLHLSQRTVESHVAHIFTKLDVRSRVTLANRINQAR